MQASFSCSVQAVRPAAINGVAAGRGVNTASPLVLHKPVHIPDLWLGRLSNAASLAIPVTNGAATWLRSLQVEVESSVACEPTSAAADDSDSVDGCVRLVALPRPQGAALALAPGQSSPVGVRLALGTSTCVAVSLREARDAGVVACRGRALTVPESSCPLPFRVRARGRFEQAGSEKGGASVAVSSGWMSAQLRCRGPGDSFAFTFTGGDGSVRTAAAIAPLPLPRDSVSTTQGGLPATVPVMLTMHGTGVSAQSQADAYKVPCTTVGHTLRRVLSLMLYCCCCCVCSGKGLTRASRVHVWCRRHVAARTHSPRRSQLGRCRKPHSPGCCGCLGFAGGCLQGHACCRGGG